MRHVAHTRRPFLRCALGVAAVAGLAVPLVTGQGGTASAAPVAPASLPGHVVDLTNWKLQLPVDTSRPGSPDEIKGRALATARVAPHFTLSPERDAVLLRAHAGGVTTSGSKYPRSELREMTKLGTKHAAWSTTSGTHELTVRQAVTHLPKAKPEVTTAQVHNGEDDVLAVRLKGKRLFVEHDGENLGDLTTSYRLGTPYTVRIVAAKGRIKIFYNGVQKVDHRAKAKNCYFKTGAYTQTNTSKGDAADAYGEVAIYDLKVKHA